MGKYIFSSVLASPVPHTQPALCTYNQQRYKNLQFTVPTFLWQNKEKQLFVKEPLCIHLLSWEKCTMATADNAHFQLCKDTWIEIDTIAKVDGSDTYK